MPISKAQRENRKNHLGSSDISALFGVDPWRNAHDVYLEKTGKLNDEDSDKNYLNAGNFFEEGVLTWAEQELGKITSEENGEALFRKAVGFPIAVHPDGIVDQTGNPVEAKTAGLFGPLVEVWGDQHTDDLPDRIILQCHTHMLCVDKMVCHVPVFLGGRGFVMFYVEWEDSIMDMIRDKSVEFWDDHVLADVPPPDVIPSITMIKRMKREPEKTVDLDDALVENWLNAKEREKLAKKIRDGAQEEMLAGLGDAEGGRCSQGLITYLEQTANRIDVKGLRANEPDIAETYSIASKSRTVRLKKPKAKKWK